MVTTLSKQHCADTPMQTHVLIQASWPVKLAQSSAFRSTQKVPSALLDQPSLGCLNQGAEPKARPELKLGESSPICFIASICSMEARAVCVTQGDWWHHWVSQYEGQWNGSEEQLLPAGQRCRGCQEDPEGQDCPRGERSIRQEVSQHEPDSTKPGSFPSPFSLSSLPPRFVLQDLHLYYRQFLLHARALRNLPEWLMHSFFLSWHPRMWNNRW